MKGQLRVDVELPSQLLGNQWQFDVRDARMRWVATVGSNQSIELDPGVYQVNGVLEDGREHQEILEVRADKLSVAHFVANPLGGSPSSESVATDPVESFSEPRPKPNPRLILGVVGGLSDLISRGSGAMAQATGVSVGSITTGAERHPNETPPSAIEITTSESVHVESVTARRWLVFVDRLGADWARVRMGDQAWRVSLPTAPDNAQRPGVELELVETQGTWRPRARIASWRVVASSLQQMLAERRIERAFEIADRASELLLHKYQDSVGAMLGALLLHRMQQLERYRSWLDNLIAEFPWWPDAAILGALLDAQSADRGQRGAALQRLIAASEKRPCFTESYAHLLDGLRRWRDDDSEAQREQTLMSLQSRYGAVDWTALTFTHSD